MPAWPWWVSSFILGCLVAWALAWLVMPDLFTTWLGFVAVVAFNGFLGHALLKSVHAAEHVLPPW